ncbi:MAG: hypothetical protein GX575_14730 [Candidatus Anammoximicrobium sp.]|nr:hypothetical protein [Candidatus Anammoximicrobium sp.]
MANASEETRNGIDWQRMEMSVDDVTNAYQQAAGRWSNCDWPTAFGRSSLDLNGLKSSQATLLARATAGRESEEWRAAARWLGEIEEAARQAEVEAKAAMHLATAGRLPEALRHAQRAVEISGAYPRARIWEPLRAAIAGLLGTRRHRNDPSHDVEPRTVREGAAQVRVVAAN